MPKLAELLKTAGVADDVAAGLPKELAATLEGYISEADTKLSTAAQKAAEAEEARRQAEIERRDVQKYVDDYSASLNEQGSLKAKYEATLAYLESLKTQGFDVKIPGADSGDGKKPIVPGSPAVGGNAVDENKILGKVGSVMSQWLDANNEHIRLYGVPIPDNSTEIAEEAARARKPVGKYLAEKYKFAETRKQKEIETRNADIQAAAKKIAEETLRVEAEKRGSNPNLRPGESSRSSHIPTIKSEEFHKADGNVPTRERHRRMLENLHKDVEQIRSVA